jgi:adenosylhomocysteinase
VEPVRALEAVMDGFQAMTLMEAARVGDIFITTTGDKHVIDQAHFAVMKSGAILANSGHFNVEINIPALEKMAKNKRTIRDFVEEYLLADGRRIFLLGEGRLINLAAAEGHPASVMDMSFANQALCLEHLARNESKMGARVHSVPEDIDREVARLKLAAMGVEIDSLTAEQKKYLTSWEEGT